MGSLKRVQKAVREFSAIPRNLKLLVFEAWGEGLIVALILRTRWWRGLLERPKVPEADPRLEDDQIPIIAEIVNKTLSFHVKKMTCLERSITLHDIASSRFRA